MGKYIKLLRTHQWIKNIFCLAGVFFGVHYDNNSVVLALLGFISFCFISSTVYILNDICDISKDRLHPTKKFRAIASGSISIVNAIIFALVLLSLSIFFASMINIKAIFIIIVYIVMNVLYSIKLKNIVIIDVFIISFGFLLRLLMGSLVIGILPSKWIILCTIMISLFLGFAKRKSELFSMKNNSSSTRVVLHDYSHLMLDFYLSIMAACSIICYSLFIVIGSKYEFGWITIPFVIFGIMRYLYLLLLKEGGQDTARDIFRDMPMLASCVLFIASYSLVIFYLK